jgi:uncharacterized protein (TIGR02466 family)
MMQNNHDVIPLFSTPVYISSLKIDNNTLSSVKNSEFYRMSSDTGWITEDTHFLDQEIYKDLRLSILQSVNSYVYDVLCIDKKIEAVITTSWITVHDRGDYAPMHEHGNSLFSGVFYINCPDDDESVFLLDSPYKHNIFPTAICPMPVDWNVFNATQWQLSPKTGDLYIFPSGLLHATTQCTSDLKRYCLAFNVFLKGELTNVNSTLKNPINQLILK